MNLRRLKPKGGYYAHLVPKGQYKAICGFEPKSAVLSRRRMRHRAGWYIANPNTQLCPKCEARQHEKP